LREVSRRLRRRRPSTCTSCSSSLRPRERYHDETVATCVFSAK
jgi:hypothetical protein